MKETGRSVLHLNPHKEIVIEGQLRMKPFDQNYM